MVGEHRLVLWDKIGPGTHPCHHCGGPVTWAPGHGGRKGSLVVDHLDDNPRNNDPANLVPSCAPCNQHRTVAKNRVRDDEPWVPDARNPKHRVRALTVRCVECGEEFYARRISTQPPRKFCGLRCSATNRNRTIALTGGPRNAVRDDELFVMKGSVRCRAVQRNCKECGTDFLVIKSAAARARFCGKRCQVDAMHRARRASAAARRAG